MDTRIDILNHMFNKTTSVLRNVASGQHHRRIADQGP